jgi:diguanylate cyclase (GGDEF)-like protein
MRYTRAITRAENTRKIWGNWVAPITTKTKENKAAKETKERANWLAFLDRAEPDLGHLEAEYRQHFLLSDALQVRKLLPVYLLSMFAFAGVDYQLYGFSMGFYVLMAMRLSVVAYLIWLYQILPRVPSAVVLDRWIFNWALFLYVFSLFVSYTRSLNTFYNASVSVLLVIVTYLLVPNRLPYRLAPAVLYSVGEILISVVLRWHLNPTEVRTNILALILANIIGYVLSIRLYAFRRSQYQAQHEEKLARAEIELLARTDGLTGTYNRRHFMDVSQQVFMEAQQQQQELVVLYLDIDFFKRINDTHGHAVGDLVLKQFSKVIQTLHPSSAIFGRLGGEEFALLLPQTSLERGKDIAEQLRASIEAMPILVGTAQTVHITVSMGLGILHDSDTHIEMPLARADQGLYLAKTSGRNRVVVH